jgi:DNA repair protein RadD
MKLRPYQQDAADAAIDWIKKCIDPCVVGAPTGAGKSYIIADIADRIHKISGKRILVLAPSGELVKQDYEKYLLTGNPASIFSASGGRKETQYPVVFGSPLTVDNNKLRFSTGYAAVIIDEAHGITPTIKGIIDHMRQSSPHLRVIGLSATPYRLGDGYIYGHHYEDGLVQEGQTRDPYFHTLVYDIPARLLIDEGYLTPPVMETPEQHYDTSGLVMMASGKWQSGSVSEAFEGRGRKTAGIVADIVAHSKDRKGVMIFASTVQHAQEVMESLNPTMSGMVVSNKKIVSAKEENRVMRAFGRQEIKYIVNVGKLTTGIDWPHVDVIAILRATESVSLLQQIFGRGLRIDEGKLDCLVLDYAENIARHCPDGDVFAPEIKARRATGEQEPLEAECPHCHYINKLAPRPNPDHFEIDKHGYFLDALGQRIKTDHGDMPAHLGRRCAGESLIDGHHVRCGYQWTYKECPECGGQNDIAARYCGNCKAEIVDPNEKLKEIAARIAKDPYRTRDSVVTGWGMQRWPGKGDKPDTLRVMYEIDESPHALYQWLAPESHSSWMRSKWHEWCISRFGRDLIGIDEAIENFTLQGKCPARILYRKKQNSKFFDIIAIGD